MTPLAVEIQRILESESAYPPLSAESLSRVLFCTGAGQTVDRIPVTVIEAALAELMAAGLVKRVFSPRAGERWRAIQAVAADVADETTAPLSTPSPRGDR